MTLLLREKDVEQIPAKDSVTCAKCNKRLASWMALPRGESKRVPFCSWCLLYGGSKWGHQNREEIYFAGRYVRGTTAVARGKNTNVPVLDEEYRLSPQDAERYVMGIVFTTRRVERGLMGRFLRLRRQVEDE